MPGSASGKESHWEKIRPGVCERKRALRRGPITTGGSATRFGLSVPLPGARMLVVTPTLAGALALLAVLLLASAVAAGLCGEAQPSCVSVRTYEKSILLGSASRAISTLALADPPAATVT